jgi:Uma2 family endonuclease
MVASIRSKRMSVEEYIRYEERSDIRHEFDNGKLVAMAGIHDNCLLWNCVVLVIQFSCYLIIFHRL